MQFLIMAVDPFIIKNIHHKIIPVKSRNRDSLLKLPAPGCSLARKHGYTHKNMSISFKVFSS